MSLIIRRYIVLYKPQRELGRVVVLYIKEIA